MRTIATIIRAISGLNRLVGNLFAWLSLGIVLVCFTVVIQRYALGTSHVWMQDLYVWLNGAMFTAVAGFALYQPVRAQYWAVNDVWLVRHVAKVAVPEDGLILSPSGTYLAAYYGPWPVTISATARRANSTQAEIDRRLTVHLPPVEAPRPFVEQLVQFQFQLKFVIVVIGEQQLVRTVLVEFKRKQFVGQREQLA